MSASAAHSAEPVAEALTRRERQILGLLAQGYSAPEIADQLTIATSSVKTHLGHLYGKLGVHGKRQAVVRGRELGLLQSSPALPRVLPAPTAQPRPRHNLPAQITSFVGREEELAQVGARLGRYRLVTLTGSGGVGKTRLSLRVAETVLDGYSDGVWLVEVAALSDPALVAPQVAAALGVRAESGRPVVDSLIAYLRDRESLLLLDNCEHLLDAVAQLAEELLRACPKLRILASSREPLAAYGEAIFHVPSLPFPDVRQGFVVENVNDFAAVRLFADRAGLVMPDYQVGAHNGAAVAEICRQLEGIPLAIELAAARVNLLTAQQLAGRLEDAFRLLTGGSRTALPRHKAMWATIDWSYQLLNAPERLLLQRLGVFAGGCMLEAAEAVCAGDGIETADVLDRLSSLVAKSIVVAGRGQGEEARYRLVELVREYAREQLAHAGETQNLLRRHQAYFLALAETGFEMAATRERVAWIRKLTAEQDNYRLTLDWSLGESGEDGDIDSGPRMINALFRIQPLSAQEWRDCNRRALAWCQRHPEISGRVYARLLGVVSGATSGDDLPGAVAGLKEAVALSRRLGPEGKHILMWNLADLSSVLASLDELDQAWSAMAEANVILHELGPESFPPGRFVYYLARGAAAKARLANIRSQYAEAKMFAAESIELYRQAGFGVGEFDGLLETGHACLELGEYDQAREAFLKASQWALDDVRKVDDDSLAYIYRCLGLVDLKQGNLVRAMDYCQASLRQANTGQFLEFMASSLALAAAIRARLGERARAAGLSGAAVSLYASTGRTPWENISLDTLLPGWRDTADEAILNRAYTAGQSMSVQQMLAYALGDGTA